MTTLLGLPSLEIPEVSEARRRAAIDKFWADTAQVDRECGGLVESVSDLLRGERVEDGERVMVILREAMPEMEWRAQVLDAHRHGAAAMARERAFIVGVRGGWAN